MDKYSRVFGFIALITHLPLELLQYMLLIVMHEPNYSSPILMLVCKHWYTAVSSLWALLSLSVWAPLDLVPNKLLSPCQVAPYVFRGYCDPRGMLLEIYRNLE